MLWIHYGRGKPSELVKGPNTREPLFGAALFFAFSPHLGKPVKRIQRLLFRGTRATMRALSGRLEGVPRRGEAWDSRSWRLNRGFPISDPKKKKVLVLEKGLVRFVFALPNSTPLPLP